MCNTCQLCICERVKYARIAPHSLHLLRAPVANRFLPWVSVKLRQVWWWGVSLFLHRIDLLIALWEATWNVGTTNLLSLIKFLGVSSILKVLQFLNIVKMLETVWHPLRVLLTCCQRSILHAVLYFWLGQRLVLFRLTTGSWNLYEFVWMPLHLIHV